MKIFIKAFTFICLIIFSSSIFAFYVGNCDKSRPGSGALDRYVYACCKPVNTVVEGTWYVYAWTAPPNKAQPPANFCASKGTNLIKSDWCQAALGYKTSDGKVLETECDRGFEGGS